MGSAAGMGLIGWWVIFTVYYVKFCIIYITYVYIYEIFFLKKNLKKNIPMSAKFPFWAPLWITCKSTDAKPQSQSAAAPPPLT